MPGGNRDVPFIWRQPRPPRIRRFRQTPGSDLPSALLVSLLPLSSDETPAASRYIPFRSSHHARGAPKRMKMTALGLAVFDRQAGVGDPRPHDCLSVVIIRVGGGRRPPRGAKPPPLFSKQFFTPLRGTHVHENVMLATLTMDQGRSVCDALSSRSSLTWSPRRTHDCCRFHGVEHAEQTVSSSGDLHRKPNRRTGA